MVAQLFHVVIGFIWAWGVMWVIFKVASNFIQIRVSPEVEIQGLDMPEFGVLAYPDFVLHHSDVGHSASGSPAVDLSEKPTVGLETS